MFYLADVVRSCIRLGLVPSVRSPTTRFSFTAWSHQAKAKVKKIKEYTANNKVDLRFRLV